MMNRSKVRRYMLRKASESVSRYTGQVCATTLAELAADEFDLYETDPLRDYDDFAIPEWVFEIAAKVADRVEREESEKWVRQNG